jgi:hypothetical protein
MLILINLKIVGYHLIVLTNQLLLFFKLKNYNQIYKQIIDSILFLKNQKTISNRVIRKVRKARHQNPEFGHT